MALSIDVAPHAATSEINDGNADGRIPSEQPKTSPFMICFSLFIGFTGLIYNFDLGKFP